MELQNGAVAAEEVVPSSLTEEQGDFLARKLIDEFEWRSATNRTRNALRRAGFQYIWQLVQVSEKDLASYKGIGRKTLKQIKEILGEMDLSLGMQLSRELIALLPTPDAAS